ncbi:MAG: histidine phosphatase family protein [Candidatus Pacearchaeota archaeon]|nr:histidine phosphatase family protein [Candidatus Pacearchaeota archaeon]
MKKKVYKIYLFRHGQTFFNKDQIFTGWKDSKLTSLGKKQSKTIAKKLKNKKIDAAFHTHLSRSIDTLKEVIKYHPECRITIEDDRMLERSYGKLEGMHHSAFIEREGKEDYQVLLHWHKIDNLHGIELKKFEETVGQAELKIVRRSYFAKPIGGESVKMVEKRVRKFIKDLLVFIKKNKVNVAVSAHGNSMRPFRRYFEHVSKSTMMTWEMPFDDYFEYGIKA